MSDNIKQQLILTQGLATALDEYAKTHHINKSHLIRMALARAIGYDLKSDPAPVRPGRYHTQEEATQGRKEKAKKLANVRKILRDAEAASILDQFVKEH